MTVIDVHTHFCADIFPSSPTKAADPFWPCMRCTAPDKAMIHIGDKPFRALDARSWSAQRRREDMARDGVDLQVISPMPELLSYWMAPPDSASLCDHVNGALANIVTNDHKHFRALGMVPMQDIDAAIAGLRRLRDIYGLSGVEIGSNINGMMLGDQRFDPFYAAAEDLDMAVFVHALHPIAAKAVGASLPFTALVGFPLDVTMAVGSLIMGNVIERFPRLRMMFSHGGGTIGAILGRMEVGWAHLPIFRETTAISPADQAGRFWYDSNIYDPALLRHLAQAPLAGRIALGTDYPYDIMQRDPLAYLANADLDQPSQAQVKTEAACAFLGEMIGA